MQFNQYAFVLELKEEIENKIDSGEITRSEEIQEFVHQEVETACIYYSECFDIIKALNFTDFNNSSFEITNVTEAAWCALWEFLERELAWNDLEERINLKENE